MPEGCQDALKEFSKEFELLRQQDGNAWYKMHFDVYGDNRIKVYVSGDKAILNVSSETEESCLEIAAGHLRFYRKIISGSSS